MQLNPTDLRAALAAATTALLAPLAPAQAAETPWQVDSALLAYGEGGGRVRALEPVVSMRRTDAADRTMGLRFTLDTLTGASPNGAVAQPGPQTFTSPSGQRTYDTAAGALPLDPSFKDTRVALAGSYERPWGRDQRLSLGLNASHEYDFTSLGASAAVARDFDRRNTTLSLGLSLEADRLRPVGGQPAGLQPAFGAARPRDDGGNTRQVADLLLGWTQVVSRGWLMQLNLGLGRSSGQHSDPYKVLSVLDAGGLLTGDRYVAERRPGSRTRSSLFWSHKLSLGPGVADASYRWYRDDWGVRAHTLDLRWRQPLGEGLFVQPHWRRHHQGAADFWYAWLDEGSGWSSASHGSPLAAASADTRLAAFDADTVGATVGWTLARGTASESALTLRVESYRQRLKQPAQVPAALSGLPVAPALRATLVTAGWSFRW